jgi:hypothetical protein
VLRFFVDWTDKITEKESLALWVYNEKAIEKILRLELLRGGKAVGRGWYCLNFRGWRRLGAPYSLALKDPKRGADGFRLLAPKGVAEGRLYLDCIAPHCTDTL